MKKFWIVFAVIAVLVGGGLGLVWYGMSQLDETVTVDGGVLVWRVGGDFAEERDDSFMGRLSGEEPTLADVVLALKRAATDDRITALVMDMGSVGADWAKVEELRAAVAGFRAQDKPVVAYLDGAATRDYLLAAAADEIVVSPEASLMVLGVQAQLDFLKDILGKLGMQADFIHVGRYKSAPERMTRTEASDANREMIGAIVDDRWEAMLAMVAESRGVSTGEAAAWIDRGLYDAETARATGLVDEIGYLDDILEGRFGDEDQTFLADYTLAGGGGGTPAGRVALVYVTGVIMPGESRFDRFQGKIAGSETVVEHLAGAREDDEVDAVLLRIDSPGGSALASDLIWHEIQRVRETKPVVVSMSGMAASGGYYVACPGDSIFADGGTLTGSIGVYAGKMDRSDMYRKIGVNREFITRGENALLFSDEGVFTADQREIFTAQMEDFYARFLAKVGEGRSMDTAKVHDVAQGRVWTGNQGRERGLVDAEGGLLRALESVKWQLGLTPDDKISILRYGKELTYLERLVLRSFRENATLRSAVTAWPDALGDPFAGVLPVPSLPATLRENGTLARIALMDGRPVAMAPYWVRVE
ncbi:MAG: signal peptide peptidase SppA [bacterium]|nr:signal peptide peptidase SppA [bacterium]